MSVRSANFTPEQIDLILDSLEACPQLVTGRLGGKIPTKHHQKLAWEAVAQRINDINVGSVKTGDQIRSKWWDLKYRAKVKATRLALKKINETGEKPTAEEILTPCEKRVLSLLGHRSRETTGNTSYDSSSVALKLLPVNILDLVNINEASNSSRTYVVEENPNDSADEAEAAAEIAAEVSDDDFSNKLMLQEVQESMNENASESENATASYNWPFAVSKPAYSKSTERAKRCRAKKRKLVQDREDSFEKKAITTQESMASDINQINITLIEMKNSMKRYMERIDLKFDKMLDLLAIALNVEPEEIQDLQK